MLNLRRQTRTSEQDSYRFHNDKVRKSLSINKGGYLQLEKGLLCLSPAVVERLMLSSEVERVIANRTILNGIHHWELAGPKAEAFCTLGRLSQGFVMHRDYMMFWVIRWINEQDLISSAEPWEKHALPVLAIFDPAIDERPPLPR